MKHRGEVIVRLKTPILGELAHDDPYIDGLVSEELSYFAAGYKYDWRYTSGRWDGKEYLYDLKDRIFPGGLIPHVAAFLTQKGYGVILDRWPGGGSLVHSKLLEPCLPDGTKLRPYQEEAVFQALVARRGIVKMGTGTGKTEVIAGVLRYIPGWAVVIVPSKDLLYQTAKRLQERLGLPIGIVGDGELEWGRITVATYQTLYKQRADVARPLSQMQCVISDEAHHVQADTWMEVLLLTQHAPYRFGLTATPDTGKGEDLLLEGFSGPICYEYSSQQAVKEGYLVPPRVYRCKYANTLTLPADLKRWDEIYTRGIVRNEARNQAIIGMSAATASTWGPTLVIVTKIEHGERLLAGLQADGTKTDFLHGKQGTATRNRLLRRLGEGKLDALVATNLLDEGVDVPSLSAVALAAGGKAEYKLIQRIGRTMRQGGREGAVVLDWYDKAHGTLIRHSQQRFRLYASEGWPVEDIQA